MNSAFFDSIGIGNMDAGILVTVVLVLAVVSIILNIVNICSISKEKKKYKKFMSGKNAKSLEAEIANLFEDNQLIKTSVEKNQKDIRRLYRRMESTFQKIGVVKYDAFQQMGGKLSFSLALLDENNNGFLLNSVHSADGCYSYTKEIKGGSCELSLGEEEAQALAIAMKEKESAGA